MEALGGIGLGILVGVIIILYVYLSSRIQMRAWIDEFDNHFKQKSKSLKDKKDANKTDVIIKNLENHDKTSKYFSWERK